MPHIIFLVSAVDGLPLIAAIEVVLQMAFCWCRWVKLGAKCLELVVLAIVFPFSWSHGARVFAISRTIMVGLPVIVCVLGVLSQSPDWLPLHDVPSLRIFQERIAILPHLVLKVLALVLRPRTLVKLVRDLAISGG
jgi:hypothetical protein